MTNLRRTILTTALAVFTVTSLSCTFPVVREAAASDTVTVASLLNEMTDLDRLTQPASYRTLQFSSYDRRSTVPGTEDWFANTDSAEYLRREGNEYVYAEATGPGAIVRIWSGYASGIIRIYLDGELVLEEELLALLNGEVEPFVPPFGANRSIGGNLYFPFPYQDSMRITCTSGNNFYLINYREYLEGTEVITYSDDQVPDVLPELSAPAPRGSQTNAKTLTGPGVVQRIEIPLPEDEDQLREQTIEIIVDGERTVWAPLGDFFGTAPGRNAYDSLPMGVSDQGVGYFNFPMPFGSSFEIVTEPPVTMWVTDESRPLRLYAFWQTDERDTRPFSDWQIADVTGSGRFVGLVFGIRNPHTIWWGEGDEKISVDGEEFPSFFGTGTEDYFGYADGSPQLFEAPYHNQTRCDGPDNRGYTSLARFHILDDIPFQSSIHFDMELWHWARATVGLSSVAYWYAEPGATHDFEPVSASERAVVPVAVYSAPDVIEGEDLTIARITGGNTATVMDATSELNGLEWSNGGGLIWTDAEIGDELTVSFRADDPDVEIVLVNFANGPWGGRYDVFVNGHQIGENADFFFADMMGLSEEQLPIPDRDGENYIRFVFRGASSRSRDTALAIDYVLTE